MAKRREHLNKAPIVESIIDFRVIPRDGVSANDFNALRSEVGAAYSDASPMQSVEARFGVDHGKLLEPTAVQVPIGIAFKGQTQIAQFRIDGFTFNKLEPYTSWNEVFSEALRLWRIYVSAAKPLEISRVAVRYINRLRLPGPTELREYLEAAPTLPPPISPRIQQYLTRIVIKDQERDASAIIIQALEPSLDKLTVPLLFDVDAFRDDADLNPDDELIEPTFEKLRDLKNEIFFASLTERTVEMYA
jgi:uncharacterized protein (TIGR04255 family)